MYARSLILLLVACLAAATARTASATAGSEQGEPSPTTTVEILVEAQTPSGRSPLGLAPGDFAVIEDGIETEVVAVEPLDEGSGRDAQRRARVSLGRRPWTVLVYVDLALLGQSSLASLASAVAGEASELTALGVVEVVVAAPEPRILLGPTRDPKLVRDALEGLVHLEPDDEGEEPTSVVSLRRGFLDLGLAPRLRRLDPDGWDLERARAAVLQAAGRESALVRRQLDTLRWWLRSYPHRPPKLLLFMTDGLDAQLAPFYLAGVPDGGLRRQLERDLVVHELGADVEETATAAGALAWTVLPLWKRSVRAAIAPEPDAVAVQQSSLLVAPSHALGEIAELTAGNVVGPLDLDRTLIELNRRVLVTYRAPRAPDAALHRVEVASARLRLRTPPWRSTPVELPPTAVALRGLGGDQSGGLDAECSLRDEGTEETAPGALRLSCDLRLSATVQKKGVGPPRTLLLTVFAEEEGGGRERIDRRVTVEGYAGSGPLRLETALPPRLRGRPLIVVLTGEDGEGGFAVERLAPLATLFTFDESGTGLEGALPTMPSAKPVYLTPFDDPMVAGPVLVEALVTRAEVVRVEFLVDGRQAASADRRPFEAWLRLEPLPEPHVISAVARGAAGDELGRDEMHINQGLGRHRVHIERPTSLGAGGVEEIEIAVEAPASIPAKRVDLFWNEDLLLRFEHPPFRTRLELPFAFEGDYLRAVAHFADGSTDEDTLLKTRRAFSMETDVEMIELYTVVENAAGRPVTDLRPEEIAIFEEGRRQELRKLERAEDVPLRLALTIDISESMQPRMEVVKRAAQEFADTLLGPRDQSLLAAFNHRPFLLQGPTGDPEILGRDIERLPVVGGTSLHDAVIFSLLQLRELPGRKAVVLLTDGKDKHSRFTLNQALDFARQSSIPLYLIGPMVEEPLALEETTALRRMATLTGGALYLIRSEHELPAVYAEIADELRHQYVLAFQSDYEGRSSEWRSLEVRIARPGVRARTMTGYFPHRRE